MDLYKMGTTSSRGVFFLSIFHLMVAFAMSRCIHQSKDLEWSIFKDPHYGNLNIDGLEDAFFPTNDRESLSVDIQYELNGHPYSNLTFRWAWSPVNLFIFPFDFQFLSLYTVIYPTGSCTVEVAMSFCSNVSEEEIVQLLYGFTQVVRGFVVDGYEPDGRKIDDHQIGYTSLLYNGNNTYTLFAMYLIGAFLSTMIPFLIVCYRCLDNHQDMTALSQRRYVHINWNVEDGQIKDIKVTHDQTEADQQKLVEDGQLNNVNVTLSQAGEENNVTLNLAGQGNKIIVILKDSQEQEDEKTKEAWDFGTTVVLSLVALGLIGLEFVHFLYAISSLRKNIGQLEIFIGALFAFLVIFVSDIVLSILYATKCKCICEKECCCSWIYIFVRILGCQLLLFHAPFVLLGFSSLPFQASVTIAMYVSVIVVLLTGISLSRYDCLIHVQKTSASSTKLCWCKRILQIFVIVFTTLLTAVVIILLAVVDIEITHYFYSTSDVSQMAPMQFVTSLLVSVASISVSLFLWKRYLKMCGKLKEWREERSKKNQ